MYSKINDRIGSGKSAGLANNALHYADTDSLSKVGKTTKKHYDLIFKSHFMARRLIEEKLTSHLQLEEGETYTSYYHYVFKNLLCFLNARRQENKPANSSLPRTSKYSNKNPLTVATEEGFEKIVEYIIEANKKEGIEKKKTSEEYNNHMLIAAERGYLDIIKLFISNGANVDYTQNIKNLNMFYYDGNYMTGLTVLHKAAEYGHYNIVKYLLELRAETKSVFINTKIWAGRIRSEKYRSSEIDILRESPLLSAVRYNHIDCVRLLLEADPTLAVDKPRFKNILNPIPGRTYDSSYQYPIWTIITLMHIDGNENHYKEYLANESGVLLSFPLIKLILHQKKRKLVCADLYLKALFSQGNIIEKIELFCKTLNEILNDRFPCYYSQEDMLKFINLPTIFNTKYQPIISIISKAFKNGTKLPKNEVDAERWYSKIYSLKDWTNLNNGPSTSISLQSISGQTIHNLQEVSLDLEENAPFLQNASRRSCLTYFWELFCCGHGKQNKGYTAKTEEENVSYHP